MNQERYGIVIKLECELSTFVLIDICFHAKFFMRNTNTIQL